jgi:hypothetical protein
MYLLSGYLPTKGSSELVQHWRRTGLIYRAKLSNLIIHSYDAKR